MHLISYSRALHRIDCRAILKAVIRSAVILNLLISNIRMSNYELFTSEVSQFDLHGNAFLTTKPSSARLSVTAGISLNTLSFRILGEQMGKRSLIRI